MRNAIIGLILGVAATATITAQAQTKGEIYPTCGIVTEVDEASDTVTFTEQNGNMFAFGGCEDWQEGDIIAATMDDNGTEEVYDDYIIDVRYAGYKED